MLKKNLSFFIFILLFSCTTEKEKTAITYDKILNQKQMTDVMVDVYLIEATLVNSIQETNNLKQYTKHYYNFLYKKHHINRQQFLQSMEYYCFHTKELSQIYTDVNNRLTAMQTAVVEQ